MRGQKMERYNGIVATLVLVLAVHVSQVRCKCDSDHEGAVECVQSSDYDGYQWSVCLSEKEIKEVSIYKHSCDFWSWRCYYLCMLETYEKAEGPVSGDCSCTQNTVLTDTVSRQCYNPDGKNCNWYIECLEARHPCGPNGYAIAYAKKFCDLYTQHYDMFNEEGKGWVDAVRGCLQRKLVHALRPWNKYSCDEIKAKGFGSHDFCYVTPHPKKQSVCDLPLTEWAKIFWVIKSAFLEEVWESLSGTKEVLQRCGRRLWKETVKSIMLTIEGTVEWLTDILKRIGKRSTRVDGNLHHYASLVADDIGYDMNWGKKGVTWVAFASNNIDQSSTESNTVSVHIVLIPESLNNPTSNATTPVVDLDIVIDELVQEIQHGWLVVDVNGKVQPVKSLSTCEDFSCNKTHIQATSGSAKDIPAMTFFLILATGFLIC